MEDPSSQLEIPFWVDGTQKWVTGITKRTTCDDVIYSLLYHDDKQEKSHKYAVHERWREVERPLQGRTKIMKIWNAWGPEQQSVQFVMRRTDNIDFMGESVRTRRRYRKSRGKSRDVRDRHHRNRQSRHNSEHPSEKVTIMENLVKLVISQERMLTDITGRLSDTESVIDNFETKLHHCRLEQNGENYVQSAYLDSLSEDSMDDFLQKVDVNSLETYLNFCDRIIQLEGDITSNHSKIQNLSVQIQDSFIESSNSKQSKADDIFYEEELIKLQAELNRVVSSNIMQQHKSDEVTKDIDYYDQQISIKRSRIERLEEELSRVDPEPHYENVVYETPSQLKENQACYSSEIVINGVHYENIVHVNDAQKGVNNNTQGNLKKDNCIGFREKTTSLHQGNDNERMCRTNIAKKFSSKNGMRKREDNTGVCRTNSMPNNQHLTRTFDHGQVSRTNSVSGCAKLLRSVHAQNHRTNTVRFQKENKENHEQNSGYENIIVKRNTQSDIVNENQDTMATTVLNGFYKDVSGTNENVGYTYDAGNNIKPQVLMKTFAAENVPKMTEPLYTNLQFETKVSTTHLSNLRGDILNVGKVDDNDSNSDTGLSSMHSDESITYLETLV